jgi:hypothetical protein
MDYFNVGDLVILSENKHIKTRYRNKLGTIISWSPDNIYGVKVDFDGKEIKVKANTIKKVPV